MKNARVIHTKNNSKILEKFLTEKSKRSQILTIDLLTIN